MPPKLKDTKHKQTRLADLKFGKFSGPRRSSLPTKHQTKQTDLFSFLGIHHTKPTVNEDKENTDSVVTFSKSTGRLTKTASSTTSETFSKSVSLPPVTTINGSLSDLKRLKRKTSLPFRASQLTEEEEE